jgi:hypothetical protein
VLVVSVHVLPDMLEIANDGTDDEAEEDDW